jgi:hypothetical protein
MSVMFETRRTFERERESEKREEEKEERFVKKATNKKIILVLWCAAGQHHIIIIMIFDSRTKLIFKSQGSNGVYESQSPPFSDKGLLVL